MYWPFLGTSSLVWLVSISNFVLFVLSTYEENPEVEGSNLRPRVLQVEDAWAYGMRSHEIAHRSSSN